MNFTLVKYQDYNPSKEEFNFIDRHSNKVSFSSPEINPLGISHNLLIGHMHKFKGKLFKVIFYWQSFGYYVEYTKGHYEIYDATTGISTAEMFINMNEVPDNYRGKTVQKIKSKRIIARYENV